ncbi:GNAT family N-acetyltransferase [Planotetraspora thailandica]|nr:GNAT family N-acetyltransferase [Planotetraspora thailandica]
MPEIRQATVAELADLARLERDAYGEHAFPPTALRQMFDIAPTLLIVAVKDDELIGHAIVLPSVSDGVREAWFVALAVRSDMRRSGTGRLLSSEVLRRAVGHGYETVMMTMEPGNTAGRALSESLGFVTNEQAGDYFEDGVPRLVMSWQAASGASLPTPFG